MGRSAARIEFLSDVIVGAVEGGTGYWAQVSHYQYVSQTGELKLCVGEKLIAGKGTCAVLHEMEEDESGYKDEGLMLDVNAVAKGITLLLDPAQCTMDVRNIAEGSRTNDGGEIDSDLADVIAQAALLGEVVYG